MGYPVRLDRRKKTGAWLARQDRGGDNRGEDNMDFTGNPVTEMKDCRSASKTLQFPCLAMERPMSAWNGLWMVPLTPWQRLAPDHGTRDH